MKLREVMTRRVESVGPEMTLEEAARRMDQLDVGALPICEGGRVIGMVTDRDIVVRAVASGRDPVHTKVREVASGDAVVVYENESVEEAARLMRQHQIRRIPVVREGKQLVGIVSLADLAVRLDSDEHAGQVLEEISQPSSQGSGTKTSRRGMNMQNRYGSNDEREGHYGQQGRSDYGQQQGRNEYGSEGQYGQGRSGGEGRGWNEQQGRFGQQGGMHEQYGQQGRGMNEPYGQQGRGWNEQYGQQGRGWNEQQGQQGRGWNEQQGQQGRGMNEQYGQQGRGMNEQYGQQGRGWNEQQGRFGQQGGMHEQVGQGRFGQQGGMHEQYGQGRFGGEGRGWNEQVGHEGQGRGSWGENERSYGMNRGYGQESGSSHQGFGQHTQGGSQTGIYGVTGQGHRGRGPKGYKRSDDRIREDVCDRLTDHDDIDASEIEVKVQNGEVTLTGTVQERRLKHVIEQIVESLPGVQEIHNQLRLKREEGGKEMTKETKETKEPSKSSSLVDKNGTLEGANRPQEGRRTA